MAHPKGARVVRVSRELMLEGTSPPDQVAGVGMQLGLLPYLVKRDDADPIDADALDRHPREMTGMYYLG